MTNETTVTNTIGDVSEKQVEPQDEKHDNVVLDDTNDAEISEPTPAEPVQITIELPEGDLGDLGQSNTQEQLQQESKTDKSNHDDDKDTPVDTTEQKQQPLSKQQMIDQITEYKQKISDLTNNVRDTKSLSEKYEHNNQYLQEYIGTLMKSRK